MLHAAGIPLYRGLRVHGYFTLGGQKISKSATNMVDALALKDVYGYEALRYFMLREMSFGVDAEFSEEALVARFNADLANDLGNLVSRSLGMLGKYFAGRVPAGSGRERAARGRRARRGRRRPARARVLDPARARVALGARRRGEQVRRQLRALGAGEGSRAHGRARDRDVRAVRVHPRDRLSARRRSCPRRARRSSQRSARDASTGTLARATRLGRTRVRRGDAQDRTRSSRASRRREAVRQPRAHRRARAARRGAGS